MFVLTIIPQKSNKKHPKMARYVGWLSYTYILMQNNFKVKRFKFNLIKNKLQK